MTLLPSTHESTHDSHQFKAMIAMLVRVKAVSSQCCTLFARPAGDWKQAIEDAQAALKFNPSHLPTWYRYGISLITAKLPEEATAALETLLKRDPE